jgi:hypothetical protein
MSHAVEKLGYMLIIYMTLQGASNMLAWHKNVGYKDIQ